MSLKDMTLDELQEGYEKGKVTDEEIEQHLLWSIKYSVRKALHSRKHEELIFLEDISADSRVRLAVQSLAEHEYQKLKDND